MSYLAMAEQDLVTVHLIETDPDGSKHVGNSHECSAAEAVALIEADAAKAEHLPRGQVPPEWKASGRGNRKSQPEEA